LIHQLDLNSLACLNAIPLRAYPQLIRLVLRRRLQGNRRPPPPDLSGAELDFFFGGTDAVEQRLANPTFRFFAPADFGSPPSTDHCELILAHRLELLGQTVELGNPIQWRRDFKTGCEWPRTHISKLKLVTREGDVKVPWELSRFHHGLTLALGWAATEDERYPCEWLAQVKSWRTDNPPEHGPNWGNAMEAAIRAVNWIAAFELMRSSPALDRAAGETILKALIQHGRFIASHLEEYWPPTNHILSNYCGLIWLGLYLRGSGLQPRWPGEADRWLERGLRGLAQQLRQQILPDGASYEASTAYHRFVTEMVASTVRLCELNNVWVSPTIKNTAVKMAEGVEGLRKPDGTLPLFGDEDGGQWLAPTPGPSPVRRTLTGEGSLPPLFGAVPNGGGPGWGSFPHAGWFIYRDGDEYLAIRAGNNGQAGWGGHAHNDALSFEYAIGLRTFFVDPGTYTYTSDPEARNLFRSTAYHNTLRVDGEEISRIPLGELFRLENDVRVRVRSENGTQLGAVRWEGEHTGYCRIGAIHQRQFEKRTDGWIIRDTITGEDEHTLEWFFHFAAGCPTKMDGSRVWTEFADGPNVQLKITDTQLSVTIENGCISSRYGQRQAASNVKIAVRRKLPMTVEFIIQIY